MTEFEQVQHDPQAPPQGMTRPYDDPAQGREQAPPIDRRTWLTKRLESPGARFFWRRNKNTIIAMAIALVLALMIMVVGFGYTLLTVIFLIVGFAVGGWRDGNPLVHHLVRRFF